MVIINYKIRTYVEDLLNLDNYDILDISYLLNISPLISQIEINLPNRYETNIHVPIEDNII